MVVQVPLYSSSPLLGDRRRSVWYVESEEGFIIHCGLRHYPSKEGGVREPFTHSATSAPAARNSLAHHMAIHHKHEAAFLLQELWEQQEWLKNLKEGLQKLGGV